MALLLTPEDFMFSFPTLQSSTSVAITMEDAAIYVFLTWSATAVLALQASSFTMTPPALKVGTICKSIV